MIEEFVMFFPEMLLLKNSIKLDMKTSQSEATSHSLMLLVVFFRLVVYLSFVVIQRVSMGADFCV